MICTLNYESSISVLKCDSTFLSSVPVSGVPRNFVPGGSTNSVEDRGQTERGSGGAVAP